MEENIKDLLLSDLICLSKNKNDAFFTELKRRLIFCGFTEREIEELVNFEILIYHANILKYTGKIKNKHWIIGKENETHIFEDTDMYQYNTDNKNTLLLSTLLAIIDEAFVLSHSSKIDNYKAKEEIKRLAKETQDNWLFFEFKNRIEYTCRCANHIINGPKKSIYNEKISILYDNEMQICMNRWSNINIYSRNFEPYTESYFISEEV